MQVQSLGWEDPLEKGMATHSSIFAWRIPWTTVAKSWAQRKGLSVHASTIRGSDGIVSLP